jgi:hypothetical protein
VSTRACHWSLLWAKWIQSTPSHSISPRSILILSSHINLGLLSLHYKNISLYMAVQHLFRSSWDSSVSKVTGNGTDKPGFDFQQWQTLFSSLCQDQVWGAASCPAGTAMGYSNRIKMTTHFNLVLRLRICEALPKLFSAYSQCSSTTLTFNLQTV